MKKSGKNNKVYEVGTGSVEKDSGKVDDCQNWASYTVVAEDAELAILKARRMMSKREYIESVRLITTLDE